MSVEMFVCVCVCAPGGPSHQAADGGTGHHVGGLPA